MSDVIVTKNSATVEKYEASDCYRQFERNGMNVSVFAYDDKGMEYTPSQSVSRKVKFRAIQG